MVTRHPHVVVHLSARTRPFLFSDTPFDAAIHVLRADDTIADVATRFGLDAATVRAVNRIAADDRDATEGRALLLPMPDARCWNCPSTPREASAPV